MDGYSFLIWLDRSQTVIVSGVISLTFTA